MKSAPAPARRIPVSLLPVRCCGTPRHGVALVIVLAFLVLIAAMLLAFFSSAQTEVQSAKNYESSVTAKQLVSSAVNVVTGQLRDGTRSLQDPANPGAGRLTWASQPGLLRTWDDQGNGGRIFKLYSSRDMVLGSDSPYVAARELATEVPGDWPAQTALFADLNSPVLVEDANGEVQRGDRNYRASFPIIDPGALADQVEGFRIEPPPGYSGGPDPTVPSSPGTTSNPAPMPVAWIYVLKDGTLTSPSGTRDGGATAHWDGAGPDYTPSKDNPIVGRIAFWTDDESCKINVNTASEPTPWDTPRAITIQDLNYGRYQPAAKEYQRFPGHPYMTALSPVFFPGVNPTTAQKEEIYKVVPRVGIGGTRGGTVAAAAVELDGDRLLANVDEFLFQPSRTENPVIDPNRLRRARFFLTANSRAPEINLYGQPRISLWPVGTTERTAYDKLAAFCATLGGDAASGTAGKEFYFQRKNPHSASEDYSSIERNQVLYRYLQKLTEQDVPGFGGNFAEKWGVDAGGDRDQILTQIFDYIRCTNLRDPQLPEPRKYAKSANGDAANNVRKGQVAPIRIGATQGFGRFHTISQFGLIFICTQDGPNGLSTVAEAEQPELPEGRRAIEAALLIEPFSPSLGFANVYEDLFFDVKFNAPMTIDGQPLNMRSGGKALTNRIGSGWHCNGRERGGPGGLRGPVQGFGAGNYQFVSTTSPRAQISTADGKATMDLSAGDITVKVYAGSNAAGSLIQTFNVKFPAANIPIPELVASPTLPYRGEGASPTSHWWTFSRRFSTAQRTPLAPGTEYFDPKRRWANDADGNPPGFKQGGLFRAEDVVRSIVPLHGDIRLIAAQENVTTEQFVPVRPWDGTSKFLHIFSEAVGTHTIYGNCNEPGPAPAPGIPGANADDQLHGTGDVQYHYARLPEIRPGAGKQYNKWNDVDNGVSHWTDGAYINKPDEGNTSSTNSPYTYFAWNFTEPTDLYFSPNRLVPSAGMLGSLPTGVKRNQPWQTLLFRPELKTGSDGRHPGLESPKDHLLMDLFWMPVIEPYALSEPCSTAGKINMNYEMAPFTYIRRATALHGAMKSEELLAIPNRASRIYKLWDHETNDNPRLPNNSLNQDDQVEQEWDKAYRGLAPYDKLRRRINMEETLKQFDENFAEGRIFRSATQICEMHLVREGETLEEYQGNRIWPQHLVTGENTRERPYANLYAKLTTKSNTFTVHVRAQTLRKANSSNAAEWAVWREGRDQQLSEHRGSTLVERYIDPADRNLVDFAKNPDAVVDEAYKFRVVATKKFTP